MQDELHLAEYPYYQQYLLGDRNSQAHRWFYFPQMTKEEVLLFKQWDSDRTLSGRVCFHTAFNSLDEAEGARCRESIEIRAFCF